MRTCDLIVQLNNRNIVALEDISPDLELEWITRFLKPETFPLSSWEELAPDMTKNLTNHLRLMVSVADSENPCVSSLMIKELVWTRAISVEYESSDGWRTRYEITEDPICFVSEFGGSMYMKVLETEAGGQEHFVQPMSFNVKDDIVRNNHLWLMQDLFATSPQTNYVADLKFVISRWFGDNTDEPSHADTLSVNWGFNGVNAVLIFRDMCRKYRKPCDGEPSGGIVIIHYQQGLGAWMQDNLVEKDLRNLLSECTEFGEPRKETVWNGSIVI